jgi:CHAT domain-containing protein
MARPSALGFVHQEATSIAAVYSAEPRLNATGARLRRSHLKVTRRLRPPTIAHFAYHGTVSGSLSLLLGRTVSLNRLLGTGEYLLSRRPIMVLSARELAGIAGLREIPAEQSGFAAGLIAISARSVVGSLWPVLDARAELIR